MYAAGLTLKKENYLAFKAAFEAEVLKTLPDHLKTPEIKIDSEINFESITPKFFRILKQFAPFGPQNLSPVFMSTEVYDTGYGKCVGEDQTHLRVTLTQKRAPKIVGIGFGLGVQLPIVKSKAPFKTVYSIDENEWNGRVSLQLKLKDLKL
jgi:single-stranded-DNA-specific exonuclease